MALISTGIYAFQALLGKSKVDPESALPLPRYSNTNSILSGGPLKEKTFAFTYALAISLRCSLRENVRKFLHAIPNGHFRLLPLILSLLQNIHCCEAKRSHFPLSRCGLGLYVFNATVTDEHGKSCAQEIKTTACFGTCESYEIGDFAHPGSSIFKYSQCDFGRVRQRTTFLTNCDEGIDPEVQLYRYHEAVTCRCESCLSFDIECMVRLTRRRLMSYSPNLVRQLLNLRKIMRYYWTFIYLATVSASINFVADLDSQLPPCALRVYNFTVSKTDINGRSCRGAISTFACYGSCLTYEVGVIEYPFTRWRTVVCNYDKRINRMVTLDDCDDGADDVIRNYRYPEAESCKCKR
ncbi:Cys knot domain containing protein [Trichuris trichiura]|uniref:Cys knot domain containing protein n=1 Tax=Trichuris trichiura TaxID=36087 RepID=A0A077Z7V2_TRITR|nr:Cys knot domain containing protein [Trichuris trichiura]